MEKEGTELEGHRLWVVQWMCVTLKFWLGKQAKHRKVEEDGEGKSVMGEATRYDRLST